MINPTIKFVQEIAHPGTKNTKNRATKPKGVSLRACINKTCKQCIYDGSSGSGTWRQQVEACTSYDCGLYPVRPKSQAGKKN